MTMKKNIVRVLALVLIAAALCTVFASCGKTLSGKYTGKLDLLLASYTVTYNFSGSKVTVTKTGEILGQSKTTEITGKYEITENDNGMEITFTFETADDDIKSGTQSFEEGDGYIKIGGVQYNKAEN